MIHSIRIVESKEFEDEQVIELYRLNKWSSADKPGKLIRALRNSDTLVLAFEDTTLVGLGNAITDGFLVVYYPHLLVHPQFHGLGIGRKIVERLRDKYGAFHQQMLTADLDSVGFYEKCGFEKAGRTQSMWIYSGNEH